MIRLKNGGQWPFLCDGSQHIVETINMRRSALIIILAELLTASALQSNIHGKLVNKLACRGGAAHFNTTAGTITSPLYPGAPPIHISCSWILHNPHQDTVILSFSKFDLDEDKQCGKKSHECCPLQWLLIRTSKAENDENEGNSDGSKWPHNIQVKRETSHIKNRRNAAEYNTSHQRGLKNKKHIKDHDGTSVLIGRIREEHLHNDNDNSATVLFNDTVQAKNSSENTKNADVSRALEKTETTGRMCGNLPPYPIITKAPRIIVKFFSHTKVSSDHQGFALQYQISNNLAECGPDKFMCDDPRLCIPKSWRCSGQPECPDSSDEANCEAGCVGVADSQHCDGRWHCSEGEDELGCFGCDADEFWCGEGTDCYKATRRCDGISDCHNGADEMYCSCLNRTQCAPNSEFCYDPKTQRCDGILHCPSGQDEIDCGGHCHHMIPCGHGGLCYTAAQRCDGASQCGDGSDEANCTPQLCHPHHGAFLCANRRCIRDAWRCDQFDDCGDASDEEDCLRNSVIVAAAIGGLVCSLLLVIAVGCTCRLYALRVGIGRAQQNGHRVGRRSTPLAPLSRLEQHLLQREPPPSYAVAVNDPSALLFGGSLSRHWRRHRRRPPALPEGILPPLPTPHQSQGALHSLHPYDAGLGNASRRASFTGSYGAGGRCSSEEKEREERAKVGNFLPVLVPDSQDPAPPPDIQDVPLLSAVTDSSEEDSMEEREDAPLLDLTSTFQETDYSDTVFAVVGPLMDGTEESNHEACATNHVLSDAASECPSVDAEHHSSLAAEGHTKVQENVCDNKPTMLRENVSFDCQENDDDDDESLCLVDTSSTDLNEDKEDDVSLTGDVMTDTRAAVLALTAVQRHTNGIYQVDTELLSH
nr:low-density lipoprotein receptor-related protein 12-like isoform X2 [Cherax quadricarinatus]